MTVGFLALLLLGVASWFALRSPSEPEVRSPAEDGKVYSSPQKQTEPPLMVRSEAATPSGEDLQESFTSVPAGLSLSLLAIESDSGEPLSGASVEIRERNQDRSIVARGLTDQGGRCSVLLPRRRFTSVLEAHVVSTTHIGRELIELGRVARIDCQPGHVTTICVAGIADPARLQLGVFRKTGETFALWKVVPRYGKTTMQIVLPKGDYFATAMEPGAWGETPFSVDGPSRVTIKASAPSKPVRVMAGEFAQENVVALHCGAIMSASASGPDGLLQMGVPDQAWSRTWLQFAVERDVSSPRTATWRLASEGWVADLGRKLAWSTETSILVAKDGIPVAGAEVFHGNLVAPGVSPVAVTSDTGLAIWNAPDAVTQSYTIITPDGMAVADVAGGAQGHVVEMKSVPVRHIAALSDGAACPNALVLTEGTLAGAHLSVSFVTDSNGLATRPVPDGWVVKARHLGSHAWASPLSAMPGIQRIAIDLEVEAEHRAHVKAILPAGLAAIGNITWSVIQEGQAVTGQSEGLEWFGGLVNRMARIEVGLESGACSGYYEGVLSDGLQVPLEVTQRAYLRIYGEVEADWAVEIDGRRVPHAVSTRAPLVLVIDAPTDVVPGWVSISADAAIATVSWQASYPWKDGVALDIVPSRPGSVTLMLGGEWSDAAVDVEYSIERLDEAYAGQETWRPLRTTVQATSDGQVTIDGLCQGAYGIVLKALVGQQWHVGAAADVHVVSGKRICVPTWNRPIYGFEILIPEELGKAVSLIPLDSADWMRHTKVLQLQQRGNRCDAWLWEGEFGVLGHGGEWIGSVTAKHGVPVLQVKR